MTNEQMELGLGSERRAAGRRQGRLNRGRWWFEQMRRVVDGALDWQSAPPARPEQVWLPNTRREAGI